MWSVTLQTGRRVWPYRQVALARTPAEAVTALTAEAPAALTRYQEGQRHPVVWLFPGQGSQRLRMGAEVYATEPVFRQHVDAGLAVLPADLAAEVQAALGLAPALAEAAVRLRETRVAQPALFLVEYALAQL